MSHETGQRLYLNLSSPKFGKKKYTLKCLSIGTPKAINFPFVSNEKLMFIRCPSIQAHYNEAVIYLNFGTPKN